MYQLKTAVFGILAFILCWTSSCTHKEPPVISVAGSTTILPFMEKVFEQYTGRGDVKIQVLGDGSMKGMSELIDGKIDIAMSSAPISPETLSRSEAAGIQIKGFPFASDLIVPIVHPSNPVRTLTLAQLAGIYAGNIKSWQEVGGQPRPIAVVTRDDASGTGEVWQQVVMKSENISPEALLKGSNSGVLAYVAEHPEAIGYVSCAFLNHEVKPLSVKGAAANRENAKEGKYPISRRLFLYVDQKEMPHHIKSLIVFILSPKGQRIAEACGFTPLYGRNEST